MPRIIRAELTKLRTTPLALILTALSVVVTVLPVAWLLVDRSATISFGSGSAGQTLGIGSAAPFFALGLGLVGMAGEFVHGTVVPTFLVEPRRSRVIAAKALVYSIAGAALVFVSGIALVGAGLGLATMRGLEVTLPSGELALGFMTSAAAGALFALLGLGLAALIRNQTAAVVTALAWFLVAEDVVTLAIGQAPARWLPGEVTARLTGATEPGAAVAAFLLLAIYACGVMLAGTSVLQRRELA